MLPVQMIRKMGKEYSDKQVKDRARRVQYDGIWWTNGFIALHEHLPKSFNPKIDDLQDVELDLQATKWDAAAIHQVWPVEIAPVYGDGFPVVKFSDGNGFVAWFDAGYISAVLKREPQARWFIKPDFSKHNPTPIAARNGQTVALIQPMSFKDEERAFHDAEWSITNDDLSAARDLETCWNLQALLPKRAGSKWHTVEYKGRKLEIQRTGKTAKAKILHVKIAGEVFAFSLYDGRRVS